LNASSDKGIARTARTTVANVPATKDPNADMVSAAPTSAYCPTPIWTEKSRRSGWGFGKRAFRKAEVPSLRYVWRDVGILLRLLDEPHAA
jgi:hypothetical protein